MRPTAVRSLAVCTLAVAGGVTAVSTGAFAATKTVQVKDDVFAPTTLSVKAGDTVRWVWRGEHPHDVAVKSGPQKFKSRVQNKGSYRRTLTRTGTYRIICTIHQPKMKMTVRVSR